MSLDKLFPNKLKCKPVPLIPFTCKVNGEQRNLEVPPTYRLADLICGEFQLSGTKTFCGNGHCGACSVVMNGKLVNSCLIMAYQANHTEIETIECISKGTLHPLQEKLMEEGELQCGYCTPGRVMAIKALLDSNKRPTREEIVEALSGNLCHCTGSGGMIRAIEKYLDESPVSKKSTEVLGGYDDHT
ncbi:(2Fe-2S)-binding protein [Neobacillus sp. LXY-4]|uniref:(2Fe-2S)-binding protein n=1 Tax=Neobacillus sp. LXY-4 TaxID=3379826 RepID=UPI003EE049B3